MNSNSEKRSDTGNDLRKALKRAKLRVSINRRYRRRILIEKCRIRSLKEKILKEDQTIANLEESEKDLHNEIEFFEALAQKMNVYGNHMEAFQNNFQTWFRNYERYARGHREKENRIVADLDEQIAETEQMIAEQRENFESSERGQEYRETSDRYERLKFQNLCLKDRVAKAEKKRELARKFADRLKFAKAKQFIGMVRMQWKNRELCAEIERVRPLYEKKLAVCATKRCEGAEEGAAVENAAIVEMEKLSLSQDVDFDLIPLEPFKLNIPKPVCKPAATKSSGTEPSTASDTVYKKKMTSLFENFLNVGRATMTAIENAKKRPGLIKCTVPAKKAKNVTAVAATKKQELPQQKKEPVAKKKSEVVSVLKQPVPAKAKQKLLNNPAFYNFAREFGFGPLPPPPPTPAQPSASLQPEFSSNENIPINTQNEESPDEMGEFRFNSQALFGSKPNSINSNFWYNFSNNVSPVNLSGPDSPIANASANPVPKLATKKNDNNCHQKPPQQQQQQQQQPKEAPMRKKVQSKSAKNDRSLLF